MVEAPEVVRLVELLNVERLERDLFRGVTHSPRRPVFGGQVLGQALRAAGNTVADALSVHSLHAYFLRPGDPDLPILYSVDRIRDGRSFATRNVVAVQNGEAIFSVAASFQVEESGPQHQAQMPDAPAPETLPSNRQRLEEYLQETGDPLAKMLLGLEWGIEQRDADPYPLRPTEPHHGLHRVWVRVPGDLPEDPALHSCLLAFASDSDLLDSALMEHGLSWFSPDLQCASLDHAVWFHRPARMDRFLLYVVESPAASGARGLGLGRFFTRDGTLVATVMQESLMRPRPSK